MTDKTPPSDAAAPSRSSVALTRASLFKFAGLLVAGFVFAVYLFFYLAQDLDRTEETESAFYTEKAMQAFEKTLRLTLKDYAFWGDAYKHLHSEVDTDWAYVRQNLGSTLYADFGFQGVFVVDDSDRTVYAVIRGALQPVQASDWLKQRYAEVLSQARANAQAETPITAFIDINGSPALVAAAPITPGTDPTVVADDRQASVLIFVDILDATKLEAIGKDYGVQGLRIATGDDVHARASYPLGENGAAGSLHWDPERPGQRLLSLGLPLLSITAVLVCLMAWVLLRRTTAGAKALDASYHSLQRSQGALATSEARFRDIVEISSDWIWEVDTCWRFTYLSERFEEVTGQAREAWLGRSIDSLLCTETGTVSQWLSTANRRADNSVHCRYVDTRGQERITRVSARTMGPPGFRGTATDVTGEVEARRQIEFLSQHDALTGLPNRTCLQAFLDGKLKVLSTQENPLVLLSLDLDRFKPVNDLLGHAAGDQVLNEVSRRLCECVRHEDLVARVGGDEFVLILCDLSNQDNVEALCQRVLASIEQPIEIDGHQTFISASIGITMAPNDALEASELLRYADIALYEAKAGGRSTWRFYSGDMNAKIVERRRLEADLRFAIKHGELRLHFQPRYRIADGQIVGAEALVRWQHPERGLIPPDTFIPIAEQTGLIIALSNWVMSTACQYAAQWPQPLFLSINLSPIEFKSGGLVERIEQALADSGLNPARVELEITESVMLDDAGGALALMHTLKKLGVRLAMDDFGTGYSSLSYLRTFPFDGLKIDRSFLNRLGESADDRAIILAIVGLGHALSLTVTAEGIETAEHLRMLNAVGCDEGQGFFLSRPLDVQAFDALLQAAETES
ncbi:bifunctional diguanylate cyclase/phosphodiesterase [Pseudomonas turukhanskensis]|uniref:Bifunctional diguanylate cyclase/phosphodiesterase n=1 Tax=Pseudomonas turukhanskensis TaxID=1806536 RepID=A0A9W6K7A3_9PSED|nr:EAL domain-containing protein [Pseudomonas turukhanskensis]GLK90202.1 bifunctional diguanylate cyclase/phosphodiesterase [Pseudomonas turukhanskensis]